MNIGKILISIARFGWKKIIKPEAVEYGPEIVADVVRDRGKRAPDTRRYDDGQRQGANGNSGSAPSFVPAMIDHELVPLARRLRKRRSQGSAVELEIDGVAVKIGSGADAGAIAAVIGALKATR